MLKAILISLTLGLTLGMILNCLTPTPDVAQNVQVYECEDVYGAIDTTYTSGKFNKEEVCNANKTRLAFHK